MASEWPMLALAESPLEIIDGDRGRNYPNHGQFRHQGYCLFLNAGNVTTEGFNFKECAFIDSEQDRRLRKGKLNRHDVVLTTRGTVGNAAYFDVMVPYEHIRINSGMVILRASQHSLHPRYLYLLTKSDIFLSQVRALSTGSAQPQLPIRDIERITIPLPPLPEQRAIAHMLGTLDDKIELNRRMNETLETMARALFKSWFVDFDPVRAKMEGRDPGLPKYLTDLFPKRLVDSKLGEIPEGWKVGCLGDIAVAPRRGADPTDLHDETPYIGLEHMPRRSIALTEWENTVKVTSNKSAFEKGKFLFGKLRPYFHKVGIAPVSGICSTDIVVITPKTAEWSGYVLASVSSVEFVTYTDQTSTGTKMPRTSWATMSRYPLCLPAESVARAFQNAVQPILDRIVANIHGSCALAALRDTLLPKLISGVLRVRDTEKFVEKLSP